MGIRSPLLLGRRVERDALAGVLQAIRSGESVALVLRGDPGVGKTALLDDFAGEAGKCQVIRASGVQSEMELAFAGLQQLCSALVGRLEQLPGHQRDALGAALGLSAAGAPDRFLVGLAALNLFAEAAAERPLICLVDDAQWLDKASAQALAFVARRLGAESVAVVFAVREASDEFAGLPEIVLQGLGRDDSRALLASVIKGPLDDRVRERIVVETAGNPLALLELPRGRTPAELAGGFALSDSPVLSGRIEQSFQERLEALPSETQQLLLVAAVEPTGDAGLVWRAAVELGLGFDSSFPAVAAELVEFGTLVRFRHPLVRSAVYGAASVEDRQSAHRALAAATDPAVDPDRRAWHRAEAASAPDEEVASELERSAGRAQVRGGLAAAAAFLERATALTIEPGRRAQRALAAAEAKHEAGAREDAVTLLSIAEAGSLDELERARAERLHAQLVYALDPGAAEPAHLLLRAAQRLEPLDPELSRQTYLEALTAVLLTEARSDNMADIFRALLTAPRSEPAHAIDLLLEGQALLHLEGYPAGADILTRAMQAYLEEDVSGDAGRRGLWFAARTALSLWDEESLRVLSYRHLRLARAAGALSELPEALRIVSDWHLSMGEFDAAESAIQEAEAVAETIGHGFSNHSAMLHAASRGQEAKTQELIEASSARAAALGRGAAANTSEVSCRAATLLYIGLGRYDVALEAAQRGLEHRVLGVLLKELIEAAVRSDARELALTALEQLVDRTTRGGTDWGLGVEACSRALLSEGETAERLYTEAIDRLGRTRARLDLARAHLLYGEWLRRERHRLRARDQLRTAHAHFVSMGAEAFAARAARELLATGETARKRVDETRGELTAQETQIARLAREGLSNGEIGARLFISPRTVEYHLHKVFGKLDIRSRGQLEQALHT
jgi:DNA-binding CsgD family transcriptional regulator